MIYREAEYLQTQILYIVQVPVFVTPHYALSSNRIPPKRVELASGTKSLWELHRAFISHMNVHRLFTEHS